MRCHVFKKSLNPHNSMGRHLRVQLRCWSNSGDARCLRDFVFVRFYVLMLGYPLTLRFELPKLLTLVVSFSLWQPTPLSSTSASPPSSWHLLHPSAPPPSYPGSAPTLQKIDFHRSILAFKIWGRKHYIYATFTRCDTLQPWRGKKFLGLPEPKSWLFL